MARDGEDAPLKTVVQETLNRAKERAKRETLEAERQAKNRERWHRLRKAWESIYDPSPFVDESNFERWAEHHCKALFIFADTLRNDGRPDGIAEIEWDKKDAIEIVRLSLQLALNDPASLLPFLRKIDRPFGRVWWDGIFNRDVPLCLFRQIDRSEPELACSICEAVIADEGLKTCLGCRSGRSGFYAKHGGKLQILYQDVRTAPLRLQHYPRWDELKFVLREWAETAIRAELLLRDFLAHICSKRKVENADQLDLRILTCEELMDAFYVYWHGRKEDLPAHYPEVLRTGPIGESNWFRLTVDDAIETLERWIRESTLDEEAGVNPTVGKASKQSLNKGGRPHEIDESTFNQWIEYRRDYESSKAVLGFDFDKWLRQKGIDRKEHIRRLDNTKPSQIKRRKQAEKPQGKRAVK